MGVGAPLVVNVAEGVHLERPEASETQRSGGVGPLELVGARRRQAPAGV